MKDFINWLKNNEKIGKVIVWLFIISIGLIILNITLESLGLPHYSIVNSKITEISVNKIYDILISCFVCIFNFYSMVLLFFRVKESKNIFKWSMLYMIINWIIAYFLGYIAGQIYIICFIMIFFYLYSNRSKKYILYSILSWIINVMVQGITYTCKMKLMNVAEMGRFASNLLSLDYFIIMAMIILVKELYLKKRGEKNG